MIRAVCLFVLFLGLNAKATDPPTSKSEQFTVSLELGKPMTVELGKKCIIRAETSAKKVTWDIPQGVDTVPLDGKSLAVWATPGTYTFRAMVPSGDDVVSKEQILTVVGPRPPPIVDKLVEAVQKAYDQEPSATRAQDKNSLKLVFQSTAASMTDPTAFVATRTVKDLYKFNKAIKDAAIDGRMSKVGAVFETDFATVFPVGTKETYVLTDTDRKNVQDRINQYALTLDQVK